VAKVRKNEVEAEIMSERSAGKNSEKTAEKSSVNPDVNPKLIPEVNIGMVGHVSHGKTTLTQALTGKLTLTHSEELKRGITIRLGYADATFYRCENGHYGIYDKCKTCFKDCEPVRTVSFIDAPGHETLMATVLSGAKLMDGAILLIAANEKCPQPQTCEHIAALEVVGIKNVVIVQSKIDLVSKEEAMNNYKKIKNFVKGSILENAPIIPVSSQQRLNIDALIQAIERTIPTTAHDENKDLRMFVARSFDINKPGAAVNKLVGGIVGGSIVAGKMKIGDDIVIRPGIRVGSKHRQLVTKVTGLQKAGKNLDEAYAGGLLGVMTNLDPYLTKSDSLVGCVVSHVGKEPDVRESLELEVKILKCVFGPDVKEVKISGIKEKEDLLISAGTARSIGTVVSSKKNKVGMRLKLPVVAEKGDRIALSRQIAGRWRLIGYGTVI
jgi:translation initiation factor 2 subunit 3